GTGVVIIVLGDVEGLGEAFSQLVGFQVNPAEEIGHFRCGVNSLKLRELVGDPPVGGRLSVAQGGEAEAGKVYAAGIEGTLFIDDALDVPDHLFRIRGKDIPVKAVGGVAVQQVGQLGVNGFSILFKGLDVFLDRSDDPGIPRLEGVADGGGVVVHHHQRVTGVEQDRKSTRLNS